jgi:hypothetical protein
VSILLLNTKELATTRKQSVRSRCQIPFNKTIWVISVIGLDSMTAPNKQHSVGSRIIKKSRIPCELVLKPGTYVPQGRGNVISTHLTGSK